MGMTGTNDENEKLLSEIRRIRANLERLDDLDI